MRLLALVLLTTLLAAAGLASTGTPSKELGEGPAADRVPGPDADGVWRFYRAAPIQRILARWIAGLSGAVLAFAVVTLVKGYLGRRARGRQPSYTYLVVLAAPSMLLLVGLWIGWGQTRIDLERGRVEIRPLGIPWPAQAHPLAEADRLVVVPVAGISSSELTGGSGVRAGTFWHVRLEGPQLGVALKVQIGSEAEARELADRLGGLVGLPVEAPGAG